jgi:hypothetical protein
MISYFATEVQGVANTLHYADAQFLKQTVSSSIATLQINFTVGLWTRRIVLKRKCPYLSFVAKFEMFNLQGSFIPDTVIFASSNEIFDKDRQYFRYFTVYYSHGTVTEGRIERETFSDLRS